MHLVYNGKQIEEEGGWPGGGCIDFTEVFLDLLSTYK